MEKISVTGIIDFRRRTPNSKITFVRNLQKTKPVNSSSKGGDYWVHSISAISSFYELEDQEVIENKIEVLEEKFKAALASRTKIMFNRNISILKRNLGYKYSKLKPKGDLKYLSRPKKKSILTIKQLPVQVKPNHVFEFEENGMKKVGGIWFVSNIEKYSDDELAIFTDSLYRYLKQNYSKKHEISVNYCIAFDVLNLNSMTYDKILKRKLPLLLNSTLEEINAIINSKP